MNFQFFEKYKWIKVGSIGAILIILLLFSITYNSSKNRIYRFVEHNQDFLNECIDDGNYAQIAKHKMIKSITPYSLSNYEVYIDFYCSGVGLAPSSIYYGFYYSSKDEPVGFEETAMNLEHEDKGWRWKEINGDNEYYTEKIADRWYYYKASF